MYFFNSEQENEQQYQSPIVEKKVKIKEEFESEESTNIRISKMSKETEDAWNEFLNELEKLGEQINKKKQLLRFFTIAKHNVSKSLRIWKSSKEIWKDIIDSDISMDLVIEELKSGNGD